MAPADWTDPEQLSRSGHAGVPLRGHFQNDPGEELQHDRIEIAAQDRSSRLEPCAKDSQSAKNGREYGKANAQITDEQAQAEEEIEECFVVQRPTQRENRSRQSEVWMLRRNEQEGFHDVSGIEL